jgi:glycerate dehydrogenase
MNTMPRMLEGFNVMAKTEKMVVLDGFAADQGQLSWRELAALGDLEIYPRSTPEEALERLQGVTAVFTNKAPVSQGLMEANPSLRYIGILATGTNQVDLPCAAERGIAVTNVAGYSTPSVAQCVLGYVLHFFNDIAGHAREVEQGAWARNEDFCFFTQTMTECVGKTLVIVGLGNIGQSVARIAQSFGFITLAAEIPGRESAEEITPALENCPRVPLAEALAQADVISLHCPLTALTKDLVDDAFLAHCPERAILINTARGGLVDESALLRAVNKGRLRAAALDVLKEEPPPPNHPLIGHPRILVTPHMAWGTEEVRKRLISEISENYAAFLRGERRNRVEAEAAD